MGPTNLSTLHEDSLLEKSRLDESEDETSSKSTEPLNEEPNLEPHLLPKKRKKLFSQQMLDSPADTPIVKKTRKDPSDNFHVPHSTQTFMSGLKEAAGRSSEDTDDDDNKGDNDEFSLRNAVDPCKAWRPAPSAARSDLYGAHRLIIVSLMT